jgi:hypothetical protein
MPRNPTWTPPINGWRYPIADECRVESLPSTLKLYRTLDERWYGQFVGNIESLRPLVQVNGSQHLCCRVLDAALRGGK